MKIALSILSLAGVLAGATASAAERLPPVIVQLGPTTPDSTLACPDFAKQPDGSWKALNDRRFGLGFVQNIVPPTRPIKVGGYIYNNIDLYSQLEEQCPRAPAPVQARF